MRARESGIPFEGTTGRWNAITDVAGVAVGHVTLIEGSGPLVVGKGPIRTGVTAILPRSAGDPMLDAPVFAGWFSLNGNGEMTGTAWIEESGLLDGPVVLTNTHSVGLARDSIIKWQLARGRGMNAWSLPVVAETYDGLLNDINGFHVREEHVFAALDSAQAGPVAEGSVGGGTGMICYGYKGGIGTSSRLIEGAEGSGGYTVGVLVQANHGLKRQFRIAGMPVKVEGAFTPERGSESGSIIILVATDAPLLPHQLKAVARRAGMGLARTGSAAGITSGDIFLAFSTANLTGPRQAFIEAHAISVEMLNQGPLSRLYEATVQATEEAIVNALFAAEAMVGIDDRRVEALPVDEIVQKLKRFYR